MRANPSKGVIVILIMSVLHLMNEAMDSAVNEYCLQ